jgi:hypothetical protein
MAALLVASLVALFRAGTVSLGQALLMDMVGIAVATYIMLWGQMSLNRYWGQKYSERLRDTSLGRWEVLIVLLGLWTWTFYFAW